jgi:hypothetical protein
MLRLPAEGEETPPLVRPLHSAAEIREETIASELEEGGEETESSSVLLLASMVVIGAALLVGFGYWMKTRVVPQGVPVAVTVPVAALQKQPEAEEGNQLDIIGLAKDATSVIKSFLNAKTLDEAVKYTSQPERTRVRWADWLAGDSYEPAGFKEVDEKTLAVADNLISLSVLTGDFTSRSIALRFEKNGLKIDWESWVGWSEMKWSDLRRQKPTESKLFRVKLEPEDYYNFDFGSDKKWTSFRLGSPDGNDAIYGYVPRNSDLETRLHSSDEKGQRMILHLHFPPNATSDNQVIIDDVIGQGWIDN